MFGPYRRSPRFIPIPAILVMLAALLGVLVTAGPACAADLVTASPASGAKLRSGPGSITLTFDDIVRSATITVTGPNGRVSTGRTSVLAMTATQDLKANLADGRYTVSYQAQLGGFIGGSTVNSSYRFTIRPAVAPAPVTKATPSAKRTPKPSPAAATPSAAATTPAAARSTSTTPDTESTLPASAVKAVSSTGSGHLPSPVVLWGLILVLCVVAVMVNRLRRTSAGGTGPRPADDVWAAGPQARDQSTASGPPTGVTRVQALSGSATTTPAFSYPAVQPATAPTQVSDLRTQAIPMPPPPPPPPLAAPKAPVAAPQAPAAAPHATAAAPKAPAARVPETRAEARRAERAEAAAQSPGTGGTPVRRADLRRSESRRTPSPLTGSLRAIASRTSARPHHDVDDEPQGRSLLPHDPS